MTDWKPAKKAYTKAQKRRRSEIREEFYWTASIPTKRPELLVFGLGRWLEQLTSLNDAYREASEGRDELINNHMLLFAAYLPELFDKTINAPNSLKGEDRHLAMALMNAAVKEAPQRNENYS